MTFLKTSIVLLSLATLTFAQEEVPKSATETVIDEVLGGIPVPEPVATPMPRGIPVASGVEKIIEKAASDIETPEIVKPALPEKSGPPSWRTRYELGAGDVLNFGLSGKEKLIALAVPVAPDGTISYLQAKRVSVLGRTIGELRLEMEKILSNYHRDARVIITPSKLGSKKYTIMGQVVENGSFPLERPTSLIQAIAKSKGIAVGINNDSAMELADFQRSFVVRNNKKLDVDFAALYAGDTSQDIQIEPSDYIYIASQLNNEYYVFGSVASPGLKGMTGDISVTGAIASAQGFGKHAWKTHVLIVRGSLSTPELIRVNMADILHGRESDVPIQRGDIVYVHSRPWSLAEDLLDVAIKSFLSGAVAGAIDPESAGVSVGN
jgi:polysaccharide export outer membrane protein